MPNAKNLTPFTKNDNRASKAGKISKRLPLDVEWRDKIYKIRKEGGKNTSDIEELYKKLMDTALKKKVDMVTMKAMELLMARTFGSKTSIELTNPDGSMSQQTIINVSPLKSKTKR